MRGLICTAAITLVCVAPAIQAHTEKLTGTFTGTGRACFGKLVVHAKTISWSTTFSRCESLPYELIEQTTDADVDRYSFKFTRYSPQCRYRYITVTHRGASGTDIGWDVIGYGSEQSYLADKANGYTANAPDTMACYLIRESK
ncbi:hypothetical protein GCM10027277_55590 [Pseudoduganella ginsengisoli]|uniref:DUF3757 domain-containing protein n=1 Tax=Pseudoduganella ginsengisoli TaxID=1462440 RepID=A0A6L6Q610_9BURK|nr:hypothetical protein [Pseudoduganella ginsengisoli]MTW04995.1 hypothetical protein [Pseudoduganella ginsengisoli]